MCIMESPSQKFGILDVKQSSKVRGRKLKTWKRRWVVLTKMSDLSSDRIVAKIDLYDNETSWRDDRGEKMTFFLDNVTSIQRTRSRTHPYAFEVIQRNPELVFSGNSEIDSFSWILTLQQIFTPHLVEAKKDSYQVSIQQNADASRWNLAGQYCLAISPACVSLNDLDNGTCYISWGLSTLMRFNVDNDAVSGESNVLVIECGRNGPTGESTFGFISSEASDILQAIRQSICHALARKQNMRRISVQSQRYRSVSETNSEKRFQNILDNSPFYSEGLERNRSGSESSGCTLTPTSPHSAIGIGNPFVSNPEKCPVLPSRRSNSELKALDESDEHGCENAEGSCRGSCDGGSCNGKNKPVIQTSGDSCQTTSVGWNEVKVIHHQRHSSLPIQIAKGEDPGYSVIKDVDRQEPRLRRNTISIHDPQTPLNDEAPSIILSPPHSKVTEEPVTVSRRMVSFEDDSKNKSELDSTIFSLHQSLSLDSGESKVEQMTDLESGIDAHSDVDSPPPPGRLNRRRSSSTPDLPAFWKHQASLENVYEELDSIRSIIPRTMPLTRADAPPALPARPFSSTVPTLRIEKSQKVVRLKKSFFFNKPKLQRGKSLMSLGEPQGCSCDYAYISNGGLLLSKGNDNLCGRCGGSIDTKDHNMNYRSCTQSSECVPVKSTSKKRRRTSDTTQPALSNFAENGNVSKKDTPTSNTFRKSKNSQISGNGLVDISAPFDDLMSSGSNDKFGHFHRTSGGSRKDPLISFFVDDDKFQSNPMVTGLLCLDRRVSNPELLLNPMTPNISSKDNLIPDGPFHTQPSVATTPLSPTVPLSRHSNLDPFLSNHFTAMSELPPSPITYTSIRQPESNLNPINSMNTAGCLNPNPNPNSNSNHVLTTNTNSGTTPTPNPQHKLSPGSVSSTPVCLQSLTIPGHNTHTSESTYHFMNTRIESYHPTTLTLDPNKSLKANHSPSNQEAQQSLDKIKSLTSLGDVNWFNSKDTVKHPDVTFFNRSLSDNEDTYVSPGTVQQQWTPHVTDLLTNPWT